MTVRGRTRKFLTVILCPIGPVVPEEANVSRGDKACSCEPRSKRCARRIKELQGLQTTNAAGNAAIRANECPEALPHRLPPRRLQVPREGATLHRAAAFRDVPRPQSWLPPRDRQSNGIGR